MIEGRFIRCCNAATYIKMVVSRLMISVPENALYWYLFNLIIYALPRPDSGTNIIKTVYLISG